MNGYTIDRKWMKRDAKEAMRKHRPSVYLIAFVFLLITLVLESLRTRLELPGVRVQDLMAIGDDFEAAQRFMMTVAANRTLLSRLLVFAIGLMSMMLSGGFSLSCLCVARRSEAGVGTLFEMFGWFFRFLFLNILMGIFIFLWSLLLVIPGIIAAYRYSMAVFIFCDDPEKGALECIRESKEMTRGYKGQLFVLDLSFILWHILCIIPLVRIFVDPYVTTTKANFYRALRGEFNVQQPYQQPYQQPPYNGGWQQ